MPIADIFLNSAIKRFKEYKGLGDKTFIQLEDRDFHFQPNEESNSLAIIVQHMSGNMLSRWTNFLTEDGEKSWRHRDEEFRVHQDTKEQLIEAWEKGWQCLFSALESLTADDLLKTIHIRQQPLDVVDAINRQLAHYSYHVGQILYVGKIIKNQDWTNLSMPKAKS